MAGPTSILSKRTTHPYPIHIPARASSATHLPLVSDAHGQDDDEDDAGAAQKSAHNKPHSNTRRRVSFDLNAILHPAPLLAPSPEDEHHSEDENQNDDEVDELPPLRTSSLSFSSQPLATHSSPDLLSATASARAGSTVPYASSRPLGLIAVKKARKLGPISIRAPLPAKAKVARRHALAQRHAAALELMLCGPSSVPHSHTHAADPASKVLGTASPGSEKAHGDSTETQSEASLREPRPKPARRWSLFSRSSAPTADNASNADSETDKASSVAENNTSGDSSQNASSAHVDEAEAKHEHRPRRISLLRRVSPSSKDKSSAKKDDEPASPARSASKGGADNGLSPKQIRKLKAALMDMDLANGIIGELRARSIEPLQALLAEGASFVSPRLVEDSAGAGAPSSPDLVTPHAPAPGPIPRSRCVLGPLLPPIEYALASAGAARTGPSESQPRKAGFHERGTSGGGSRDDSALPDRVFLRGDLLRDTRRAVDKKKEAKKGQVLDDTENAAPPVQAAGDGSEAGPVVKSAARRSLANILNRVRKSSMSSTDASAASGAVAITVALSDPAETADKAAPAEKVDDEESGPTKQSSKAAAVVVAAAALIGIAAASTKATATKPEPVESARPPLVSSASSPSLAATPPTTILEEEEEEEEEAAEGGRAEQQLGILGAVNNLNKLPQPPTILGMSALSLAFSPRTTIVTQVAASSGAFDALADLSSAIAAPAPGADGAGLVVGFPTDRLSFVVHWWGYEILLPPLAMAHLSTAQSISSAFLSFLQTMAISASLPEMLPFIKYISMWVELEFRAIHEQDARGGGKGVVLAATWVMPMALVPRAWDLPVASNVGGPTPTTPVDPTSSAASPSLPDRQLQQQQDSPRLGAIRNGNGGGSGAGGGFALPPSASFGRDLRNRLDGRGPAPTLGSAPAVPAKDAYEPPLPLPSTGTGIGRSMPALLPIPVRF